MGRETPYISALDTVSEKNKENIINLLSGKLV